MDPPSSNRHRNILLILVPLAYAAVLSFSIGGNWFVVDDRTEVFFVRDVSSFWRLFRFDAFGLFRPVKNLLFFLFVHLSEHSIKWGRLVAIGIGILSFFPVCALCRRILDFEWKGLAAATVWLLSPTLVSSVAWLSCANIQVMAAFAALAMVCHDSAWDDGTFRPRRIALAGTFLFLAFLSYECALATVPILLLFDLLLRPGRLKDRSARTVHIAYWATVFLYLALRTSISAKCVTEGIWMNANRWQLAVSSPWFTAQHFASWFWPFGRFTVLGGYRWGEVPVWALVGCAALGLIAFAVAVLLRKKLPALSFCLLFAIVGFAPVSNCLGSGNGPYGDYYLTLASIGLSAGCVEIASLLMRARNRWRIPALLAVIAFASTRVAATAEAARWARLWSDGILAIDASIRNFPDVRSNRDIAATLLREADSYERALDILNDPERLERMDSSLVAVIYLTQAVHAINEENDAESALEFIEQAERIDPNGIFAQLCHHYRGCALEDLLQDAEGAATEYERALDGRWSADLVPCANRLARLKAMGGNLVSAIELWEKALKLEPNNVPVLLNLSVACLQSGDKERGEELRNRAIRLMKEEHPD